ncbi:uncharacterized [Tachysurus ichikawai]
MEPRLMSALPLTDVPPLNLLKISYTTPLFSQRLPLSATALNRLVFSSKAINRAAFTDPLHLSSSHSPHCSTDLSISQGTMKTYTRGVGTLMNLHIILGFNAPLQLW